MTARIPFPQVPAGLMAAMMNTEEYLRGCGFDIKLQELIKLRASLLNGCAFCIDMHFTEGLYHDEKLDRLYALTAWQDSPVYTAAERAVLDWVDALTDLQGNHDLDSRYTALLGHFNRDQIAHLSLAISQINAWNRLAKAFGFEAGSYQPGRH